MNSKRDNTSSANTTKAVANVELSKTQKSNRRRREARKEKKVAGKPTTAAPAAAAAAVTTTSQGKPAAPGSGLTSRRRAAVAWMKEMDCTEGCAGCFGAHWFKSNFAKCHAYCIFCNTKFTDKASRHFPSECPKRLKNKEDIKKLAKKRQEKEKAKSQK